MYRAVCRKYHCCSSASDVLGAICESLSTAIGNNGATEIFILGAAATFMNISDQRHNDL
ncbi:MAG: hypothetical protein K6B68_14655 [Eubacterium sp.]|nr:hypothetical protein [Eubacterium sp.]